MFESISASGIFLLHVLAFLFTVLRMGFVDFTVLIDLVFLLSCLEDCLVVRMHFGSEDSDFLFFAFSSISGSVIGLVFLLEPLDPLSGVLEDCLVVFMRVGAILRWSPFIW